MKTTTMALSGLLLAIASLPAGATFAQSDAAESDATGAVPAIVEGTFGRPTRRSPGSLGLRSDGVTQSRNQVFAGIPVEASDPRLDGTASISSSSDTRSTEDGSSLRVFVEAYEIVNGDGRWSGMLMEFTLPGDPGDTPSSLVLRGAGDYAGLTAVISIDFSTTVAGGGFPFEGAIFSGDPPPVPEAPSSE